MSRFLKKFSITTTIVGAAVLLVGVGLYSAGARVNTTKSIPVGIYWMTDAPVEKGAYVIFCPPQVGVFDDAKERGYIGAGFCPGGYGFMMKRVLAAKGDRVSMLVEGVFVNGQVVPFSASKLVDGGGLPLPRPLGVDVLLADDEVLLMASNPKSFDGRYFGPIQRSQIKSTLLPVFTW